MFLDLQVIGSLISSWLNYGIYFIFPSQIRTLMDLRSRKEQSTRRNTEQIFISNNVDASSRTKIINLEFPSTNIYYKVILRIIQRLSATISKSEFKITFYCLNSKIILDVNFEDNTKVSWKLLNTATFEWKLKLSEIQIHFFARDGERDTSRESETTFHSLLREGSIILFYITYWTSLIVYYFGFNSDFHWTLNLMVLVPSKG